MSVRTEAGWRGSFTRDQAEGAIPNGARVRKVRSSEGDAHPDGAEAAVLGSLRAPAELEAETGEQFGYFVEWADAPRVAVGIMGSRIEEVVYH